MTLIRITLASFAVLGFLSQGTWGQTGTTSLSVAVVASSTVAPPTTTVYVGGEQPEPTQTQGWSDGENGETGENGENGSGGPCFDGDQPCEVYLDAIDDCNGTWPQNTDSLASCQCGANHLWLNSCTTCLRANGGIGNFTAQGPSNCAGINATATAGPFASGSLFGIAAASGGDRVKDITGFGVVGIVGIVVAAMLA